MFLLGCCAANAQQNTCLSDVQTKLGSNPADALTLSNQCLQSSVPDSIRLQLVLLKLKAYYFLGQNTQANAWADSLLAEKKFNTIQQAELYRIKGALLYGRSVFRAALDFMQRAAALSRQDKDLRNEVKAIANMGNCYNAISMPDSAAHYLKAALLIDLQLNDSIAIAGDYNSLATTLFGLKQHQQADSLLQTALSFNPPIGLQTKIYQNLATTHTQYNPTKAKQYILKVIDVQQQTGNPQGLQMALHTRANIEINLSNLDSAQYFMEQSLNISKEIGDSVGMFSIMGDLGRLLNLQKKDPQKAIALLEETFYGAYRIGQLFTASHAARDLVLGYAIIQQQDSSQQWLFRYDNLKDAIFNDKLALSLADVEIRHEVEKKQLHIAKQDLKIAQQDTQISRQRLYLFAAVAALLLAVLAGFALWLRHRYLRQLEQQKEWQKLHQAIFETEQKERVRIARDLHDSLGQKLAVVKMFLTSNPAQSVALLDEAIQETRHISHNLLPEVLRLGLPKAIDELADTINQTEKIKVVTHFSAPDALNLSNETALSVFRMVQEILGNMLKYAQASQIDIRLSNTAKQMEIVLQDNGKGFDNQLVTDSKGIGWKNISARCQLLGGHFQVLSSPNKGTTVILVVSNIP